MKCSCADRVLSVCVCPAGYCLPEPVFLPRVKETVESVMTALRDPALPLLELQVGVQSERLGYRLMCVLLGFRAI